MRRPAPAGLKSPSRRRLRKNLAIGSAGAERSPTRTKIDTQRGTHDGITYITLDLSKEDHHEYYNGFNRVDLAEFSRRDLSGYLRVNDHFARELHEVLEPSSCRFCQLRNSKAYQRSPR